MDGGRAGSWVPFTTNIIAFYDELASVYSDDMG